jgi:hypothetical protein
MFSLLFTLTSSLNGILDFVVPLYFISALYTIVIHQQASQKAKLDADAKYALPKVEKVPKPKRDWKELVDGNWIVSEAENVDEWILFNKVSAITKLLFPKLFFRLKHETHLTDTTFQFSRYMRDPEEASLVVKMKLHTTEDEAMKHAHDCQIIDSSDKMNKTFTTFINEEEKSLTTFIAPVDMSGSKLFLTHVRKIVDDDHLSVVSSPYLNIQFLKQLVERLHTYCVEKCCVNCFRYCTLTSSWKYC